MTGVDAIRSSLRFRSSVADYLRSFGLTGAKAEPLHTATTLDVGDITGIDGWSVTAVNYCASERYGAAADRVHQLALRQGAHGAAVLRRKGGDIDSNFVLLRLDDFAALIAEQTKEDSRVETKVSA